MHPEPPDIDALVAQGGVELGTDDPAFTAGLMAITADEAGRYTRFAISAQGILAPPGSRTTWLVSNDIAGSRNEACELVLEDDALDWVWFIDDDHAFGQQILTALLARRVDIVTPICLRRQQPFLPVSTVNDDFLRLRDYGEDELVQVQFAGASGMLIRKRVLAAVEPPWFELGNGVSEDVNFCRKATEAGFPVHVDMAVRLGHISTAVIWPTVDDEHWVIGFEIADGAILKIQTMTADGEPDAD